jgi:Mg2+ and Co2+ transporter CorA
MVIMAENIAFELTWVNLSENEWKTIELFSREGGIHNESAAIRHLINRALKVQIDVTPPTLSSDKKRGKKIPIDSTTLNAIRDYQHTEKISKEAETIRLLINRGISIEAKIANANYLLESLTV